MLSASARRRVRGAMAMRCCNWTLPIENGSKTLEVLIVVISIQLRPLGLRAVWSEIGGPNGENIYIVQG